MSRFSIWTFLEVAREVVLRRAVVVEHTPVLLDSLVASRLRLPGLIVSLENKGVNAPSAKATDALLPELLSVLNARLRTLEVLALSGPAGLTNPEVNVGALDRLDLLQSLHDVVGE